MKLDLAGGEPQNVNLGEGWYHVVMHPNGMVPVRVSPDPGVLAEGGGNFLYPGYAVDLYAESIWLEQPATGRAEVFVEKRQRITRITVDPHAGLRGQVTQKGGVWEVTPGVWQGPLVSNVQGMIGLYVRVVGGSAWISTHPDRDSRPDEKSGLAGDGFPIRPSDPPLWLEGNPGGLYIWTDERGVQVYILKHARDWNW